MKKNYIKVLSLILALILLIGSLAACDSQEEGSDKAPTNSTEYQETQTVENESESHSSVNPIETDSETTSKAEGSTEKVEDPTEETDYEEILSFDGSQMIEYADHIKDGTDASYLDPLRSFAVVSNMEMELIHGLNGHVENDSIRNLITSISNKKGEAYLSNTMDAFVKTTDGKTYYASDWVAGPYFNILRGGYYYNDVRISGQGFGDTKAMMANAVDIDLSSFVSTSTNQVSNLGIDENGILSFTVDNTGGDPGIQSSKDLREFGAEILSKNYNALLITMKTQDAYIAEVFIKTHTMNNYSQSGAKNISLIPGDDFHTYVVRLDDLSAYKGYVTGIRIDLGKYNGEVAQIKSIKAVNLADNTVPVRFERGIHAYSDKMHQELHFVTTDAVKNLASYGMVTNIAADTVSKLIVKDANGTHKSLADVDWSSAEYVGFDIKNAGVFGYILAKDESSGKLTVSLEGESYVIMQEYALAAGTSVAADTHFYMGHRIYTDDSHSFAEFEREAYIERNPLGAENIVVESSRLNKTAFVGYDHLRGAYEISLVGTGFSSAYYQIWNRHYRANVTVKGDHVDRKFYLYASASSSGLECAAILNSKDLMMPVPLEVIKNFAGDGEESIFLKDLGYSETYLPVVADKDSQQSFSLLNLYQNWGRFPLKQLSWIQFGCPYYHLSTGVTETNCIMPMYSGGPAWQIINDPSVGKIDENYVYSGKNLSTLPDFRAMSGILWKDQPQHNSCMDMKWLSYTTADGSFVASENTSDKIDSFGPIYADITLDYVSDDGKIDLTYRHAEMPQTDENRTYYSIRMAVKDEIRIASFKDDFNIFETNSRFGPYEKIGYLNEGGECVIEDAERSGERRFLTLGKEAPYFGYFYYYLDPNSNMCNYAVIIKDWDIKIGGEQYDGNLIIEERFLNNLNFTRLTLDLGEVTLKEGDYINIDMILLPWGKANDAEDTNVRQVRQDSCLDPYKVEAKVGSVIEDEFIPKIKAENNTAEFTFSGGHNNGIVRIYGFDKLTAPTIMELVDGEWIKYEIDSSSNPDKNENFHYYDGYCVYYDGDCTYSYAFVIPTENGSKRTFKVTAEDFVGFPEDPASVGDDPVEEEDSNDSDALVDPNEARPEGEGAPKLYFSAQDLYLAATAPNASKHMLDEASLRREDGVKFARYLTYGLENQDAYIVLHSNPGTALPSGKYIAIKYRTKTPNASMEFWVNSNDISYNPGSGNTHVSILGDYKWHYAILDLSVATKACFNGKQLHLLRFDFLNSSTAALPANSYIDIAYIAFFDSESEAGRFEFGDEYRTKEEIKRDNYALCVDPESGYSLSEKVYGTNIDYINGNKYAWSDGNSKDGVSVIDFNASTLADGSLAIAGWTVVDGGIAKYIWSADGGKTWFKTGVANIDGIGSGASNAHYKVITGKIGAYTFSNGTHLNSTYQKEGGVGGISINLSAYNGKTVDVVFAAVPVKDTQAVCPLILLQNVTVAGSSTAAEADEMLMPAPEEDTRTDEEIKADNNADCIDPESDYSASAVAYCANIDFINAKPLSDKGGNSKLGCSRYTEEIATFSTGRLVFTGWVVVDGGVKDYVWSMDGGKTWSVIPGTPGDGAGTAHYNVAKGKIGEFTFSEGSNIKSTFAGAQAQGENISGLGINLSSYSGQTLSITFAAIPVNDTDGLCLIAHLENIKVVAQ